MIGPQIGLSIFIVSTLPKRIRATIDLLIHYVGLYHFGLYVYLHYGFELAWNLNKRDILHFGACFLAKLQYLKVV